MTPRWEDAIITTRRFESGESTRHNSGMEKGAVMEVTRRSFLEGAATGMGTAVAATGLFGAHAALAVTAETMPAWDAEADLVVVGLGAAGASCAYNAVKADPDATVIVLEKQPEDNHHPSTEMSGGVIMYTKDPDLAAQYMQRCAGSQVPEDVTAAWATEAAGIRDYVREIGFDGEFNEYTAQGEHEEFEHCDQVGTIMLTPSLGAYDLWEYMLDSVDQPGITIEYSTPGQRLVERFNEAGEKEIIGVQADKDGTPYFVKANKAVILTCGGFEWNEKLKKFLPADGIQFYDNPANTGDGVLMAQAVGAQLWHMNKMLGRGIAYFEDENLAFIILIKPAPYIMVDKYGQRFVNEDLQAALHHSVYYSYLQYDAIKGEYPRIPSWWIFDSNRIGSPLTISAIGATGVGYYDWSADNSKEIEKGWIVKADTLEELAEKCELPIEGLQATMAAYDAACDSGEDEFGRSADTLIKFEPPYYAMKLWPGGPNTSGGPERDAGAHVLNVWEEPIARLYSAGELGQAMGDMYPAGGGDISEAICFGAIAARNAVAEQPWE